MPAVADIELVNWYYLPYFAAPTRTWTIDRDDPVLPRIFDLRGIGFAAWTLAAFAIGALAGTLIRRVVPAIVATQVAYAALAFAAGGFLRQHYLAPLVTSNLNLPGSAWIISQWWTKGGKFAFSGWPPDRLLNAVLPERPFGAGGAFRQVEAGSHRGVPHPARLHAVDQPISPPAGSGRSSGSRAAGCSCCRPC